MNRAVDITGLCFHYKETPVFTDLSFTVHAGNFFIIIGPNGSGKTTLLKTIAGILNHKEGQLNIMENSITDYSRKELSKIIAFVPQTIPDDFPFTVTELVLMGRAPYLGMLGVEGNKDYKMADQAISFTGVNHLAHRKLTELSGGERQRVFIARAICQNPRIMLLDEPTASLDLAHQVKIMDLMKRLKEEKGITVVMVSHDINLAAMYGDRLLLIKNGRMVSLGTPEEVLTVETLEKAYECRLLIDENPTGNCPRITLVPGERY